MARSLQRCVWVLGLGLAALGISLGAPLETAPVRLLVPAYFYPAGEGLKAWDRLIAAADKAPIVAVVDPDNGPGKQVDENYRAVLERARRSQLTLIGYVTLAYAKRPADAVKADVDRWLALYPGKVDGIFFDEQPSGPEHVPFVAECFAHARRRIKGARIVSNPGTVCAAEYLAVPGRPTVCLFEAKTGVDAYQPPSWGAKLGAEQVAVLLYDVPKAEGMKRSLQEMLRKRAGYVYVTDDSGANPWDRLPSYWDEEVAAVAETNRRTPGR
ncbi:MAG: spherulation-specific family 4 protein [Isosphaeraceae bacterium]|nr:spherulation-specific family 4 protein [Isosphaeraceae bacterium]